MKKDVDATAKPIFYKYIFRFMDGDVRQFDIRLDPVTLERVSENGRPGPDWTRLGYYQCSNCPLEEDSHPHCPVATAISSVVDTFRDCASYENVHVVCMSRQRDISKNTSVQEGLSAILGLLMPSSGCPVMAKLKPLVRYHMPFTTIQETVFRVASMYLLVQFFLRKKGLKPDWEMKNLSDIYSEINHVNDGVTNRLKAASEKDGAVKAVANLDHAASLLPLILNEVLSDMESSIDSYMPRR